jgi:hypothetical protein
LVPLRPLNPESAREEARMVSKALDACGTKLDRSAPAPQYYRRRVFYSAVRIAIICDNFSPHLSTRTNTRVSDWAAASNVEIAYTPTNSSWLNRI